MSDFALVRWSVASICASALISGVVVYGVLQYADRNGAVLHAAQLRIREARNQLAEARDDRQNLSAYAAEYRALEGRDIIGDNHRLDWMEGLEGLRRQNLVADFRYNISPQKNYSAQPAFDSGNFVIHYSEMKLQFDLLHEGQLMRFFDALRQEVRGYYLVEGCKLVRSEATVNSNVPDARLKAECTGGWITLKNRNTRP